MITKKAINPGNNRHRITIQKVVSSKLNTQNEKVPIYGDWISRWAEVSPLQGREYLQGLSLEAEISHRIKLRYDSETRLINPSMRVFFNGREMLIQSVLNIGERNREIQLMCVEELETHG